MEYELFYDMMVTRPIACNYTVEELDPVIEEIYAVAGHRASPSEILKMSLPFP
tara:strand:- start:1838 stop:1996 length:159 start_codon:yes stop_codon:yes gene_type:complete